MIKEKIKNLIPSKTNALLLTVIIIQVFMIYELKQVKTYAGLAYYKADEAYDEARRAALNAKYAHEEARDAAFNASACRR